MVSYIPMVIFNMYGDLSFYPSFRMYFSLLTLVVCMTLSTCRAPVFPYRNFGIRCFQLKQNGVTTWNVYMKNLSNVQELDVREYCHMETFNASCPEGKVIVMETARYGRMNLGRCLTTDYSVGCSSDVITHIDSRCSGRRNCSVHIPDKELFNVQSCRRDLVAYFEASYKCVIAIETNPNQCIHGKKITNQDEGYISSDPVANSGSCTLSLTVQKGQHINITLYDFASWTRRINVKTDRCPIYAAFKEGSNVQYLQMCEGQDFRRQVPVFTSQSNTVNVSVLSGQRGLFMLHYQASGCPDVTSPPMARVTRVKDTLMVTCNNTREKWHLVCKGRTWVGDFSNCTKGLGKEQTKNKQIYRKEELPVGLLVAIALGVLLGVFAGFIFLLMAFMCRRGMRHNQQSSAVHTTLLGTPDYHGNTYKMVDVDIPAGEDPCYMCHHEASVYTKSGLEVPNYTPRNYNNTLPNGSIMGNGSMRCNRDYNTTGRLLDSSNIGTSTTNTPSRKSSTDILSIRLNNSEYERPVPNIVEDIIAPVYDTNTAAIPPPPPPPPQHNHSSSNQLGRLTNQQSMEEQVDNCNCTAPNVVIYTSRDCGNPQAHKVSYAYGGDNLSSELGEDRSNSFGHKTMMEKYPLPSVSLNAELKYS